MTFLLISGLPASGKSTLAQALSPQLGMPVVDKDAMLERLFREKGVGDAGWRSALSREADLELEREAMAIGRGILVSWWRHPKSALDTGTSVDWVRVLAPVPLEVHCVVDHAVAAHRFMIRRRHHGHLDGTRTMEELHQQFAHHASHGPLGIGPYVTVSTLQPVDIDALLSTIRSGAGSTLFENTTR